MKFDEFKPGDLLVTQGNHSGAPGQLSKPLFVYDTKIERSLTNNGFKVFVTYFDLFYQDKRVCVYYETDVISSGNQLYRDGKRLWPETSET